MQRVIITSTYYHTRYHTFSLSLPWFGCYLQRVTTRYRQIYKKIYINIKKKKKITVMCGNALQIAQNDANLRENIR